MSDEPERLTPECWLCPPEQGVAPCVRPVEYRLIAFLHVPGQPTRLMAFGQACGPHLAAASQQEIFLKHHDVLACWLPHPKPDGVYATFGCLKLVG